ncbi:hypothetical protein BRADI_4g40070v3 [Brachypodium distachyon]|uniref:Exostosin GT47 domain-containing protein n=1 Tax=Brachypodium distachyon TaxID=15368 RepID=A0A0Q3J0H2_BRADI|nr:hypothetical protein BRADI_4g40070v3 [Brachypodium distachyon]
MEAHYPKYVLYGVLIVGSWLVSSILHFQFFHLSLFSSSRLRGVALLAVDEPPVPAISLNASFIGLPENPPATVVAEDNGAAAACEGRYVYMVDLPSRYDVLRDCVEGSPEFDKWYSQCTLMSNAGMGPALPAPTGDGTDGDTGLIGPDAAGWYNTDQYALEVIFHNRMRRYPCLTGNPSSATAVYVPYYPALELQQHLCGDTNSDARDRPSSEFIQWLSSQPRWTTLGGRDHFLVASKTTWMFRRLVQQGAGGEKKNRYCGNNFLDSHPETANMTVLTYESNLWSTRREDFAVPYPSYFHPSSADAVSAWQARVRSAPRRWLFAFAGARRANGSRCGRVDCGEGHGDLEGYITCRTPRRLVSIFGASRFCLQPRGDSFMRRSSVDAVMAGCVPVFFHQPSTFKTQYRWHEPDPEKKINGGDERRYSVLIDADEVMQGKVDIEEVLGRYTDQEVAAMREEVIKMIPRFLYKDPRVRFDGETRDAFDIAIDEVLERVRRIKNGEDLGLEDADGQLVVAKDL